MNYFYYGIIGVVSSGLLAWGIQRVFRYRYNYLLKKAMQEKMVEEFNSSIIAVKCPCFKNEINIPFHPQATPKFDCPKCKEPCGYSFEFKTFKK